MEIYVFILVVLVALAVFDLIVGVSNDAVNFLNSSIGSRVAPRHVIMIIASLGMLAGVTFSSGMMEVARKGIFQPQLFLMPELITIFLAVMLTDVLLLDLFNTFGLPTSTTVSIVFELLGAAVAVSLIKIYSAGNGFEDLVNYINTAKALAIITGILLSVVIAFVCGAIVQFISRMVYTFDYMPRLKLFGGLWAGISLAVITYFILIKGAKGASFLTAEQVKWMNENAWTILSMSFVFFGVVFQFLATFTRINILKPIVLIGTFALAMAFAANDLVNFIGVPLAGIEAFRVATTTADPLTANMGALQAKVQTNTFILLGAGVIMIITLWVSRKARSVTETQIGLSRQDEGVERFGSFALSRGIVGMMTAFFDSVNSIMPLPLRKIVSRRLDPSRKKSVPAKDGKEPAFDLLRASVNLIVASAVVSYATSMKLPLSTTYVTFMVAMGTSLSDQAWGKESAVYRVTGVLTVVGGWFCTALIAFVVASLFATAIHFLKLYAIVTLILFVSYIIWRSFHYHTKQEEAAGVIKNLNIKDGVDPEFAVHTSFEQVGYFLNEVSLTLRSCFDAVFKEDRSKLKELKSRTKNVQQIANIIIANIFKTLYLLDKEDAETTRKYSRTIGALQDITESNRDIVMRAYTHVINYHTGLGEEQKKELQQIRVSVCRLLENTAIMLLKNKKVDYEYIQSQRARMTACALEFNKNQIHRIQNSQSKTRLSILYYGFLENCEKITIQTQNLLDIFRDYFSTVNEDASEAETAEKRD
ncbi:MAG: inorganic phosphate transporter [Proteobacteria bacterium]|nr:inorganic phosphate transporter [Pseudomonadota bacterium]MBU1708894.1 inorganic phosphate transporter [Pseudomonadota bacterium]